MHEYVLTNARIVLADEVIVGSVKIDNGLIADIDGPSGLSSAHDYHGDYLIPGLVELHTDNLERHAMPRPRSYWPVESAVINHDREIAAAGITTVFDALSVGFPDQESRSLDSIKGMTKAISQLNARGVLKAEHFLHWRCEVSGDGMYDFIEPLSDNDRTALFSIMDHTPGQRQFTSLDTYYTYYQGKYGLSDEDMEALIETRVAARERNSDANRTKIVNLAHSKNIPIASHDDATLEHVDEAIRDGIVVAEFPTTIEAAKASHDNNLAVLLGAPNVVRGQSHSGNVSARDLANAGVLDILSSDYMPFSLLYGAVLLERHSENITLPQAIATVTRNPAYKVGLEDRGEIAIGQRADLVRFRFNDDVPNIMEVWNGGDRVA